MIYSALFSIAVVLAVIDPVIGVLGVAVIGPLITYLIAAKRFSGKVASSDATELWTESRSIREWSSDRISELNHIVGRLEARVEYMETQNERLLAANATLNLEIRNLLDTNHSLQTQIAVLEAKLKQPTNLPGTA